MPPEQREIRFRTEDVVAFAAASGDRNPLHLDAGFARQTAFGSCVVHGALIGTALLGALPPDEASRARAVRLRFTGPVVAGAACRLSVQPPRRSMREVQLSGRGKILARLQAGPKAVARDARADTGSEAAHQSPTAATMRTVPAIPPADHLFPGRRLSGSYAATPDLQDLAAHFGGHRLHPALLESLAWASYVVGMELPGLHSLLAGITLALPERPGDEPAERYTVAVRDHDRRTGHVVLEGALSDGEGRLKATATIECFALDPVAAPNPEVLGLRRQLPASRGQAVVIGASRGFGASITLALIARGFKVHGAYSGSSDGAAVLEGLVKPVAADRLHLHVVDARDPEAMQRMAEDIDHSDAGRLHGLVLNAALPPIPMGLTGDSAAQLADYVGESVRMAAVPLGALLPLLTPDAWIVFCSSSVLAAPPRDWAHYVTAKAALEGLAAWTAAVSSTARTVVLRPPAMRTGMTNTPGGRLAAVPPEAIAAVVADRLTSGELPPGLSLLDAQALAEMAT